MLGSDLEFFLWTGTTWASIHTEGHLFSLRQDLKMVVSGVDSSLAQCLRSRGLTSSGPVALLTSTTASRCSTFDLLCRHHNGGDSAVSFLVQPWYRSSWVVNFHLAGKELSEECGLVCDVYGGGSVRSGEWRKSLVVTYTLLHLPQIPPGLVANTWTTELSSSVRNQLISRPSASGRHPLACPSMQHLVSE